MGFKFHYRLFFILFLLNLATLFAFNQFLGIIQNQSCISYTDFLQPNFTALNLSYIIFPLTYLPVLIFLVVSIKNPARLNLFAIAYLLIILTRMLTIGFFPLCEPAGAIRLEDTILNGIFYPNGYCPIDLFYSGHTATLFMLGLISPKPFRDILISLSIILGTLLVIQKVHYTIDVLAAFPITLLCYYISKKIFYLISKETYIAK